MSTEQDRTILRELARQVAEIAARPVQAERRKLWKLHNSLQPARPLLLVFPEGSWRELVPDATLRCAEREAREMELELRRRIYTHAHFHADNVIEGEWVVQKVIRNSGWGLDAQWTLSTAPGGARAFKPVLHGPADLKRLRWPEIEYDARATDERLAAAQELFGDLLDVKLKGVAHLSYHLMSQYSAWRGLEQTFLDMLDEPEMLHEAMAFLAEGHRRVLQQYVAQNLLSLNNDNTYHSTGGNGYTDELPAPGFDPRRVRPCDLWASAESQELTLVSPEMHGEFALAYEKRLLEPFGLSGYGCCDDLTRKLDLVCALPGIRRISCSPFAGVEKCAARLGGACIFSWKPQPAHLAGDFNAEHVRTYIQRTVDAARRNGCVLEIILKDTHTCENHPERFDAWTKIAREIVEAA